MPPLTIGLLAEDLGVSVDTVRYYERRGLLPEPERTDAGYRSYAEADREKLAFILRAKDHGFTLKEIAALLEEVEGDAAPDAVRAAAARKLAQLDEQRRELDAVADRLAGLLRLCDDGDAEGCASLVDDPCRA